MGFKRWWENHTAGHATSPASFTSPEPPRTPPPADAPRHAPPPRPTHSMSEDPDPTFTHLTATEGTSFRALVDHHASRLTGSPITIHSDHFIDADGRAHGLWGLAGICRHTPSTAWSDAIEQTLRDTLTRHATPPLSSLVLADALKLRLVRDISVADASQLPHCSPVAPGLVEVVTLDLPDRVIVPEWNALSVYGSREGIIHQARHNLVKEAQRTEIATVDTPHGVTITRMVGDPYYTASIAIVIDQLAPTLFPHDPGQRRTPWLVRIPTYGECFLAPAGQPTDELTVHSLLQVPSSLSTSSTLMPDVVYVVAGGRWMVAHPIITVAPYV